MHLMIEEQADDDKRRQLLDELTGPFRTMGGTIAPGDEGAPAWWHGDEDAYESTMAAMGGLRRRG